MYLTIGTEGEREAGLGEIQIILEGDAVGKEPTCQGRRHKRCGFDPWVRKIPWRSKWQPTPIFLPGKFHGQRGSQSVRHN